MACYYLQQAAGHRFKGYLSRFTHNRLKSFFSGIGITAVVQSSSASTVMVISFVGMGLMSFEQVLGFLLGAGIGSTVTAQLISFHMGDYSLILIALGFLLTQAYRQIGKYVGHILLGFGFVFFSMNLLGESTSHFKDNELLIHIIQFLSTSPLWAFIFAALFTAIVQASAATLALLMVLARLGLLDLSSSMAFILGANLGTCFTAILASHSAGAEGRRVAWAFFSFKLLGVLFILPFLSYFEFLAAWTTECVGPWIKMEEGTHVVHQIANAHTLFNVLIGMFFLPAARFWGKWIYRIIPIYDRAETFRPLYLEDAALSTPAFALAQVSREVLRMGEIVQRMLQASLVVIKSEDLYRLTELRHEDDKVDTLNRAIKLYLAKITQDVLTPDQAVLEQELLTLSSDLEHVGDIISKNILAIAEKKIKKGMRFSEGGFAEIKKFFEMVIENLKLTLSAFAREDIELAKKVLQNRELIKKEEFESRQNHFIRLAKKETQAIDTTSLHLDLLSHLCSIDMNISNVARLIIERRSKSN